MVEKPEKVFPCDCCAEGLVVSVFEDVYGDTVAVARDAEQEDEMDYYTVGISFWGVGSYTNGQLSWRDRLRLIWYVIKHGHPWTDMVDMKPSVARNFAHHILYRVDQMQKKIDQKPDELKRTNY